MAIETVGDFCIRLADLAAQTDRGLNTPVKFATGPDNEFEVASIYVDDNDVVWIDLEAPLDWTDEVEVENLERPDPLERQQFKHSISAKWWTKFFPKFLCSK